MADSNTDFRAEFRAWLADHPPPRFDPASIYDTVDALRSWQQTLAADRWVGIHWPTDVGGRDATLAQVVIYNQELARAGAPPILGRAGVSLVGPTLMAFGTPEQRQRWLRRILTADDIWCQLFSEPGAGSDLAALTTRAERRGDHFVVTGQKVWSSYAQWSDWGIALVRTNPSVSPHRGISMLAVDMRSPGIDIRPLRQMTGEHEFNEVFFDQVEVPIDNLIGAIDDGWRVAHTTLANERGASFVWREQVIYEQSLARLIAESTANETAGDPRVRQRLAQAFIDVTIFGWHNARTMARIERGDDIGAHASLVKLFWASLSQRFADTAVAISGTPALLHATEAREDAAWRVLLLATRANSIMGGSSEIQRNIIGERMLGLPREPRNS